MPPLFNFKWLWDIQRLALFPNKCCHVLFSGEKIFVFCTFKILFVFISPQADDEDKLLWSCDGFSVSLMYLLPDRGELQTHGSSPSSGVVPFFCVTRSLGERAPGTIQDIFNNTFSLLTSLRRLKLSCCFLKEQDHQKKSQLDEVHCLSLPEHAPKDTGLFK